jgi:hypothetical protein
MTDTITADTIRAARRYTGRYATADTGAHLNVVATGTPAGPIVEAVHTGALARLVQTGRKIDRHGQVRVRIEFARDTGDLAGTLDFGGTKVGGRVPADVFPT